MQRLAIGLFAALLLGGCAGAEGTTVPSGSGSASSSAEPDLAAALAAAGIRYTCGGHPFTPDVLSARGRAETGDSAQSVVLREFVGSGMMETESLPEEGWLLVGMDGRSASFVAPTADPARFEYVLMDGADDAWRVTGWGGCRPQVWFEDANPSTWVLEPAGKRPAPEATEFVARVTETTCASGQSSRGRVQPPIIVYTAAEVVVTFPIEPLPGDGQDCQGNPSTAGTVTLDEPLGDRTLLDGGTYPPGDPAAPQP